MPRLFSVSLIAVAAGLGGHAQDAATSNTGESPLELTLSGYLETYLAYNFNDPDAGSTAVRGFDDRHQQVQLANAVFDVDAKWGELALKATAQIGNTPDSYYAAQPDDFDTFRHLQQLHASWKPGGGVTTVQAGLFLSPIGPEGMAVKDNLNFSRSNLFYFLPFYHAGVRVTRDLSASSSLTGALYNGWNRINDNNGDLSVSVQWLGKPSAKWQVATLYFGGVERDRNVAEGDPWRHLFDLWARWEPTDRWVVMVHGDVGHENNDFGKDRWSAGALYLRWKASEKTYVGVRVDRFSERWPTPEEDDAAPIFWGGDRELGKGHVQSTTVTLEHRPRTWLAGYLELRRDSSSQPLFFDHEGDTPDADDQTTVTLGAVLQFSKGVR